MSTTSKVCGTCGQRTKDSAQESARGATVEVSEADLDKLDEDVFGPTPTSVSDSLSRRAAFHSAGMFAETSA